jgi:Mn-dependent DtxR family transcriptional regulator
MNRLHKKGLISDPKSKAKSVVIGEEGYQKAKDLFWKHFGKE